MLNHPVSRIALGLFVGGLTSPRGLATEVGRGLRSPPSGQGAERSPRPTTSQGAEGTPRPTDSAAILRAEFIHEPGAYPQCHASTIAETPDGGLIAAWFGGTHERNPDVCIYARRFENGMWGPERKIADGVQPDGTRYPCWNPVLFRPRQGPLLVLYRVGPSPSTWWGEITTSRDDGKTWSAPRRLPEGILGPIKDKPIELADGTIVCGSSTEDENVGWRVHVELIAGAGTSAPPVNATRVAAPDFDRVWAATPPLETGGFNAIQPTILTHPDGVLQLLCRTKEMQLATSWSKDGGRSWTPLAPSGIFAPNSGIDAVTLRDGRQLLIYNHRDAIAAAQLNRKSNALGAPATQAIRQPDENWGVRWPLNVAISPDGVHWKMVLTLESAPRKDGYAYPAVIQTRDGLVHVTYTWDRVKIKHVVIDPTKL